MSTYNIVLSTNESTVVTEYEPQTKRSDAYQSEAALEAAFIKMLGEQGYEYVIIHNSDALIANLRRQLEVLNKKQAVIEKLKRFFEKYFGLVSPEVSKESDKVTYLYDTEPTLSMVAEEPMHYGMKKDN